MSASLRDDVFPSLGRQATIAKGAFSRANFLTDHPHFRRIRQVSVLRLHGMQAALVNPDDLEDE